MQKKKILIVRFSSIGDVVLTTPVIRCLKKQLPDSEVHFVTKKAFQDTLINNPYIDRLFTFGKDVSEIFDQLKSQDYDLIIDLHKNLRSLRLKQALKVKSYSFNKLNLQKFAAVNFKMLNVLPPQHIVERYLETVSSLGVVNDGQGLDYFISEGDKVDLGVTNYTALVVGGSYYTKKIPLQKLEEICRNISGKIVLLGGKEDQVIADQLQKLFPSVINTCGKYSINQSASVIQNAAAVITSDTGLMHIAAAFNKKIISIWGNTIPQFGMGPYLPNPENQILEIKDLKCRPCSKLGFKKCPKQHFKCMMDIDVSVIKL